jgi:hypothetical protein
LHERDHEANATPAGGGGRAQRRAAQPPRTWIFVGFAAGVFFTVTVSTPFW